jgi:hypothetical protein
MSNIPVSVAHWKAARRFSRCRTQADDLVILLEDEPIVGGAEPIDARSHLVNGRDIDFPTDRRVLDVGAVIARHAAASCAEAGRTPLLLAAMPVIFQPVGSGAVRGHARRRHIVARWLIDFRDRMLTLDKNLLAMYPRQPYS